MRLIKSPTDWSVAVQFTSKLAQALSRSGRAMTRVAFCFPDGRAGVRGRLR